MRGIAKKEQTQTIYREVCAMTTPSKNGIKRVGKKDKLVLSNVVLIIIDLIVSSAVGFLFYSRGLSPVLSIVNAAIVFAVCLILLISENEKHKRENLAGESQDSHHQ